MVPRLFSLQASYLEGRVSVSARHSGRRVLLTSHRIASSVRASSRRRSAREMSRGVSESLAIEKADTRTVSSSVHRSASPILAKRKWMRVSPRASDCRAQREEGTYEPPGQWSRLPQSARTTTFCMRAGPGREVALVACARAGETRAERLRTREMEVASILEWWRRAKAGKSGEMREG